MDLFCYHHSIMVRLLTFTNLRNSLRCDFSFKNRPVCCSLVHEFSTNKNVSLLVSFSTGGRPFVCGWPRVEVHMFMLQVNKAASSLIQPSSVNSQLWLNGESVEQNGEGIWPHLINHWQITAKATSMHIKDRQMQNCNWTSSSFKATVGLPGDLSKSLLLSSVPLWL